MKVVLIGLGQAGGKITQRLAEFDYEMGFDAVRGALAVNTAQADIQPLEIDTLLVGRDRVKGHGVGADNELGAEIMQDEATEVMDALEGQLTTEAEAIVLVAGLGGGTGSGGAPALAKELKRVYNVPVYALGILPGQDEGSIYQANAGRSLKTLAREADSTLLIDNDAWHSGDESLTEGFKSINDAIAQRVGLLFAAGEMDESDDVAESVVDSSEIINTLKTGGIASLGYASAAAADDAEENISAITSTTRNALLTGTSLPKAVEAEAGLLVVAGRPELLARKGVERARSWLEEEIGSRQVRGGDFPLESDRIAALVLLGGVERSQRIQDFLDRAREASERAPSQTTNPDKAFKNDELEDLF
jgi:cell division GTPase FtsZ